MSVLLSVLKLLTNFTMNKEHAEDIFPTDADEVIVCTNINHVSSTGFLTALLISNMYWYKI